MEKTYNPLTHSLTDLLPASLNHSEVTWITQSPTHLLTSSIIQKQNVYKKNLLIVEFLLINIQTSSSHTYTLTHYFPQSLRSNIDYSLTHSLTYSLNHSEVICRKHTSCKKWSVEKLTTPYSLKDSQAYFLFNLLTQK